MPAIVREFFRRRLISMPKLLNLLTVSEDLPKGVLAPMSTAFAGRVKQKKEIRKLKKIRNNFIIDYINKNIY